MNQGHRKAVADEIALARQALEDASRVLDLSPRMAAREAYLAMLHAAHARIAAAGRPVPRTHKGVNVVIGELYEGPDFNAQAQLAELESWKMAADYGRGPPAERQEAAAAVTAARGFIDRMLADIGSFEDRSTIEPATLEALRQMESRGPSD